MDLHLSGQCALVSGGSRGIGRSIALALAGEGCRVAVVARGQAGLDAVLPELATAGAGPHAVIAADVATRAGAERAVDQAAAVLGGLDVVVTCAGKSGARHCRDMDDDDFAWSLDINLWSAARVCQRAAPVLAAGGGGAMVMISSIWGREAGGAPGYNVAKAGVVSLAKAMARDYAADGIRVNSVAPGSILFPGGGWERRRKADPDGIAAFVARELPFGRFGTPEEVAAVVTFLCSPRASWVSGTCVTVDGAQGHYF
ncbi:SDR family NAD(P)-dependent oxidoreductase [Haliangium sp.]|uniref:SDR family NAD(P)-dependent oxidoreductase n=1 Tax=Haliangium sp. TaxID=2663208 RepID=UPI003D1288CD